MPKPHLVSGKLKGEYPIHLASASWVPKTLCAVMIIEPDNAWHVEFAVTVDDETVAVDSLSKAVRIYDEEVIP